MYEAYGQTEITGGSHCTYAEDGNANHVGGISCNLEMKLEDVPELDYLSTDQTDGVLTPRGEICVRGHGAFKGYFKLPEKTAEALDADGWVHTGDIGMIQPNGALRIVDRKKNIFKLSQGEYVAAEAGNATPASRRATRVANVRPPPAESPAMAMFVASIPCASNQRYAIVASSTAAGNGFSGARR